jgi:hypothetical protein
MGCFRSRSFARDFLRQLLLCGLLDQNFVLTMDSSFSTDSVVHLHSEAQDVGVDLEVRFIFPRLDISVTPRSRIFIRSYRRILTLMTPALG